MYGSDAVAAQGAGQIIGGSSRLNSAGLSDARQPEIGAQLERLESALKGCMQGLETLDGRLQMSVLRGEAASQTSDRPPSPTQVMSTPLGDRLRVMVELANIASNRIQSINARIEA